MIRRILLYISVLLLFAGCSDRRHDARLERVALTVAESPEDALRSLDSIDRGALAEGDRHYYDFLALKARDKAYIVHTSDSAYLSVYRYYSDRENDPLYPEVLYYGGRVYSDMGDYPTALGYFQQALDRLPADTDDLDLRNRVLSQTGRLLNSLRLYDEAIPYIRSSIEIDRKTNDTIGEVYDLQLLGGIYLRADAYSDADSCFRLALAKSSNLPNSFKARSLMYLADIKLKIGQIDSAIFYINNTQNQVNPATRNYALACAAEIYRAAGILDSTYLYAHELINSNDNLNKETGYQIILSPELRNFVPYDTAYSYLKDYLSLLESYFNENENQLALNQQSQYNYRLHDRERQKAEESNELLKQWLFGISILVLVMCIVILYLKNRDTNNKLELHTALENVEKLRLALKTQGIKPEETDASENQNLIPATKRESAQELREKLRTELYNLYKSNIDRISIDPRIVNSETYNKIQALISNKKELKEDNPLWLEIEELVLECSPNFRDNLQLLVRGSLTKYDLYTALLIKCGIKPTEMIILLNRTKGTISFRRENLCNKIFDEKLGAKVADGIIRLL